MDNRMNDDTTPVCKILSIEHGQEVVDYLFKEALKLAEEVGRLKERAGANERN